MGKCISKGTKYNHDQLKKQFTLQMEKENKLKKINNETIGVKSNKLRRMSSKTNFKMKDFVNKNYNLLIEEYR